MAKAFALEPPQPELNLELLFYALTHDPESYPNCIEQIKTLISNGARSPGWDLSRHVGFAKEQNSAQAELLADLAEVITNGADPVILNQHRSW